MKAKLAWNTKKHAQVVETSTSKLPPPPPDEALPSDQKESTLPHTTTSNESEIGTTNRTGFYVRQMQSDDVYNKPATYGEKFSLNKVNDRWEQMDKRRAAIIISCFALLVALVGSIGVGIFLTHRVETAISKPNAYAVLNINETYKPGGYYGWEYNRNYPDMYPMPDIHAKVGDRVVFAGRWGTNDDVYLVPPEVFESCNFTNQTKQIQLAMRFQTSNENGYVFLVQQYHFDFKKNPYLFKDDATGGKVMYFTSSYYWDRFDRPDRQSCRLGVKLRVFLEQQTFVEVMQNAGLTNLASSTEIKKIEASIGHLSRGLILQQFNFEQRIRSEGDSGLTQVRQHYDGDKSYDDGVYSNNAIASIHNHADHIRVVGIGEISAVLNGVEFTTRHNDYNLNQPSPNMTKYHKTIPVPRPPVPPEVTNKASIAEEITEMKEWFRAFKEQNKDHRNYTKYFKPILCYLEGTWITDTASLDEPFDSDRHAIDAKTWKQLHDKIRWMMNSGRKNSLENLAHLPSAIRYLVNDTYPVVSNWEYRILCAPLKNDIPLSRFKVADDLHVQISGSPRTRSELYYSRKARFKLNTYINTKNPDGDHRWSAGRRRWDYLDYLMEQIPGKDNYPANLTDILPDGTEKVIHYNSPRGQELYINSGYYSRYYALAGADAMGSVKHRRGFKDRYFWAAQTTHEKVSPIKFQFELPDNKFVDTISRWSYAIPMEIIFLTPLTNWNPYNIKHMTDSEVTGNGARNGKCTAQDAYLGWSDRYAFFTPYEFFVNKDSQQQADTSGDKVCVMDDTNTMREVRASGHWITFPEIDGVGLVRQRFPIMPVHEAGGAAWKEAKALHDVTLKDTYDDPVKGVEFFGAQRDEKYGFQLYLQGGGHQHSVYIPGWKIRNYWKLPDGNYTNSSVALITVDSDERAAHSHTVKIWRYRNNVNTVDWIYKVSECRYGSLSDSDVGWTPNECEDLHGVLLRE